MFDVKEVNKLETVKKVYYPNLRAEIARHGDTLEILAKVLDISVPSLSRRLSGDTGWSIEEADILCKRYNVPFEILFVKE